MADSDDDFSLTTVQDTFPKKSKLSKKKKNEENVKKPHTSTQNEVPEPITSRGGRPARKTAEELKFQQELEDALRISSTDVSSSSAEIVSAHSRKELIDNSKGKKSDANNKAMVAVDEILVVSDDSQDSVKHGISSAETVDFQDMLNRKGDDSDEEDIVMKKRKFKVIDSDDEFETEVSRKPVISRQSEASKPVTAKVCEVSKKRKVEETWVVSGAKKTSKAEDLKTTLKRTVKPKKYTGESFDSETFSDDDGSKNGDESDDEFVPATKQKKTPLKKPTLKKTPVKTSVKPLPSLASGEPNFSPKKPLGYHNSIPSPSIPLPKSKNMFQNKSPIKLAFIHKSPVPVPAKPSATLKSLTPGPTSSISSILKQFQNQTKSTPIMGFKAKSATPISPAPSTPLQKKLPGWTPPAKVGTPGSSSLAPGLSPSIGLRVGLSRNFKSKPLHSGVKYP